MFLSQERFLLTHLSLEAILNSLRPVAPRQRSSSTPPSSTLPNPTSELSEELNQFSILDSIEESSPESTAAAMSRYEASISDRASLSKAYVGMENETMEKILAVHGLVLVSCDLMMTNVILTLAQELDILCSKVKHIWQQASSGEIPLLAAAWLTNGAYHVTRQRLETGAYPHILEDADHHDLCDYARQANKLPAWTYPDEIRFPIHHRVFQSMHGMLTPMDAILEAMRQLKAGKAVSKAVEKVKLAEVVTVAQSQDELPGQVQAERKWIDGIITSMWQIEDATKLTITSSLLDANPLMQDVLRPEPEEEPAYMPIYARQTPSVFGLMLLVESTKSFVFPENTSPQTMNCRLKALKLARDLKASVMAVKESRPIIPGSRDNYPICTDDKLIKGLKLLEDDLSAFLTQARWDFYYQAPWVAGGQMLWMLSQANDYGMVLCNRRRYVGAVLHLYNCLKQLGQMEAEPVLLERLYDILGQQVFRSASPPRMDFFKVWARYVGRELPYDPLLHHACPFYESYSPQEDRLKFKPRDRLWRVATQKFQDDKRISLSKISHFYALESIQYEVNSEEGTATLARMLHVKEKGGDATDEETAKVRDILSSEFLAITLEKMQPAIVSELEGEFPVAKINWFAVYLTCTGVLESLGRLKQAYATDPEQKERMGYDFAITGVRDIEMFLSVADQGARTKKGKRAWAKEYEAWIKNAANAISHELLEKKTADFVWQT